MINHKKILVLVALLMVAFSGFYIYRLQSRPERSMDLMKKAFEEKNTVLAERVMDAGSISDNIWPRWKALLQRNMSVLASAILAEQESDAKNILRQALYEAVRGSDNVPNKVFNALFVSKIDLGVDDDVASARLVYKAYGKSYNIDFIFRKSETDWRLVDIQGIEEVMQDSSEAAKQQRDIMRISNMSTLKATLSIYLADIANPQLCEVGETYHSNEGTDAIDGTGWLPINLTEISFGSPVETLPKDPVNENMFVYSYSCDPSDLKFQFGARMESEKYGKGGSDDVVSTDSGHDPDLYEVGN